MARTTSVEGSTGRSDGGDSIRFEGLTKRFDTEDGTLTVFDGLSFEVPLGSFTSIMGPSGCGKSTFLNVASGLYTPEEGEIRFGGDVVEPGDFDYAYVFQEPRLLDWLTVGENVAFALDARGVPESEHDERVEKYLEMVGLGGETDNYPQRLSGGMRQRVGIARALAVDPDVLLMDEPFGSLDEITARELRHDLLDIWTGTDKTVLFVTHDISEAVFLSDRVLFLNANGGLFNRATVDHERPRSFDDPDLLETEGELMETFFSHIGVDE
jgi:NitT/TauT family transport system ATP-binding protein